MNPSRTRKLPRVPRGSLPDRQHGAMLMIALIVLVAMTLAGIAAMRSVDTGAIVAGNIGFKQSTVNAADQGLQTGYTWLSGLSGSNTLYNDDNALGVSSVGYFSNASSSEPDWSSATNWIRAANLNGGGTDTAGNTIQYVIHRLCPVANCAPNDTCSGAVNTCGSTPDNTTVSGDGTDQSSPNTFTRKPATHYRITARAVGPRNSITVVQTLLRIQ